MPSDRPRRRLVRTGPQIAPEAARFAKASAPSADLRGDIRRPVSGPVDAMTDDEFEAHIAGLVAEDIGFTPELLPEESAGLLPGTPHGWTVSGADEMMIDRVIRELRDAEAESALVGLSPVGTYEELPEDVKNPAKFFGQAIPALLAAEGGYTPGTNDKGGKTNYGIALKRNPEAWGLTETEDGKWRDRRGDVWNDLDEANERAYVLRPTQGQAIEIYQDQYWRPVKGDALYRLDPGLAQIVFDGAVNHGVGGITRMLQRIVGADVDGAFGPLTFDAVARYVESNGARVLKEQLLAARKNEYDRLNATGDEKYTPHYQGWMRRLEHLSKEWL